VCRVLGPRWRAIRLAVMVGSSRLYESRGRTAGFRIRSSVLSGACWIDRAVFAGVNPTGRDCMMALRFQPAGEVFAGVNPTGERPYAGSRYSFLCILVQPVWWYIVR
jgi:hypothetical protein